jgi:hypothetical protein
MSVADRFSVIVLDIRSQFRDDIEPPVDPHALAEPSVVVSSTTPVWRGRRLSHYSGAVPDPLFELESPVDGRVVPGIRSNVDRGR